MSKIFMNIFGIKDNFFGKQFSVCIIEAGLEFEVRYATEEAGVEGLLWL